MLPEITSAAVFTLCTASNGVQSCRNPQHADIFMSTSGDCTAMVWDARQAVPSLLLQAHTREILAGDWCKYNDCLLVTGSIDKSIKVRRC